VPKQIGRYRAIRVLGHGGMGVVYLVENPQRDLPVAVKLVRLELA
jgi:serine/threonine protein kinase